MSGKVAGDRVDGDGGGFGERVAVDAGRDGREAQGAERVFLGEGEAGVVAGAEECGGALAGLGIDGPYGVEDIAGGQPSGAGAIPSASFVVRFHLHPTVKAARMSDGRGVVLTLASGDTWRFGADAALELADSVYLGDPAAVRKMQQIVVYGVTAADGATVKWALKKIASSAPDPLVN